MLSFVDQCTCVLLLTSLVQICTIFLIISSVSRYNSKLSFLEMQAVLSSQVNNKPRLGIMGWSRFSRSHFRSVLKCMSLFTEPYSGATGTWPIGQGTSALYPPLINDRQRYPHSGGWPRAPTKRSRWITPLKAPTPRLASLEVMRPGLKQRN